MDAETANALPRRRSARVRPKGRHRSPDRLSVPSAAPVLVLAVPAAESAATAEIAAGITSVAGRLCPGPAIRVGYAGDGATSLASLLTSIVTAREAAGADEAGANQAGANQAGANQAGANQAGANQAGANQAAGGCPYAAVVIPLAIAADPDRDARIADVAGQAGPAVTVTPPLGPHPLLAAALHDRLAQAGLVQARRLSGLSLVPTAVGALVGTTGGEPGLRAAEIVAVLLTSRLGVPVAPFSLGSRDSRESGVTRLREAGASRLALAPYVLGPEISPEELAAEAAAAGAECAPALGAHPALGQLVTMRYGAALLGQPPPGPADVARLGRRAPEAAASPAPLRAMAPAPGRRA